MTSEETRHDIEWARDGAKMDARDLWNVGCTCGRTFGPGTLKQARGRQKQHAAAIAAHREELAAQARAQGTPQEE